MTDETRGAGGPVSDEEARLRELRVLTGDMRVLLQDMVQAARDDPAAVKPADLIRKLGELHSAHLKVLEKEEAFHARLGKDGGEPIDYDAIRASIGRKLDRIRAARDAEGVSGGAD
ncbi:hypothetical protein [Yoonia sp.]|uniref:hypothetical protein n=1 Tax=Yoonia sp. TaxID=2212373 RepID=UPI002FD990AF